MIVAVAIGGYLGGVPPLPGAFGVSLAEAKQFYTRKRVNGRWVTGTFPKNLGGLKRVYTRLSPEPRLPEIPLPPSRERAPGVAEATSSAAEAIETTAALGSVLDVTGPGPAPADERLARLRDALQVRASELVTALVDPNPTRAVPPVTTPPSAPAVPPPTPETLAAAAPTAASVKPVSPLEPRSVSYDFETGVKTTVFENSVVREPFDVASMKRMAAPRR